jgi:hypothetical protein
MNMLKDFLTQLRTTPRLRWGVALIIGTLWLYAVLLLHDNLQQQTQQHRSANLALVRLQSRLTQTEWLTRVTPAQALAVQLEGKLWKAATAGLAQAAFQDALSAALLKAAATRPQVSVTVMDDAAATSPAAAQTAANTSAGNTPPDLWKVKAKVGFDFSATSLLALLNQLDANPTQIIIGSLGVNKDQPNHVDLEVYAYFQKPTSTAPALATPASAPNTPTTQPPQPPASL